MVATNNEKIIKLTVAERRLPNSKMGAKSRRKIFRNKKFVTHFMCTLYNYIVTDKTRELLMLDAFVYSPDIELLELLLSVTSSINNIKYGFP